MKWRKKNIIKKVKCDTEWNGLEKDQPNQPNVCVSVNEGVLRQKADATDNNFQ